MKKSNRFKFLLALLAFFALVAASCGDTVEDAVDDVEDAVDEVDEAVDEVVEDDEEAMEDDEEAMEDDGEPFRVAIVAPSPQNDLAFTQSMVDAVNAVSNDHPLEVAITDGQFIVEDAGAAIRGYAEEGYDLVVAHGSQYGALLEEIAPEFPEVSFAWGTAADTKGIENVNAYTVRADEGGYVLGTIAAQISETGVLGVVGPVEVGDAKLYVDGFKAGAEATEAVEVNVNYIDSFSDVALAAEAATAHIGADADILTGTAQMVVGATGVAQENGVPWFGTQANQAALGEDIVVASQVYHWEVILTEIIAGIEGGTLGGEVYTIDLDNGGLVIEFNDGFELDAEIKAAAEQTVSDIIDGTIKTGV